MNLVNTIDSQNAAVLEGEDELDLATVHPVFAKAPRSVSFNKLRKRLIRQVRQAIDDFDMLKGQKRWLVGLSGGKDSAMACSPLLLDLQWRGLLPVELIACNLDQGQPNFPKHILPDYLASIGVPHRIEYRDTYSIVKEKVPDGRRPIARCVRGCAAAISTGSPARKAATRVVLGHHREDILETFFMNFFHGGRLSAMPAKLLNDERRSLMVLRPLGILPPRTTLARFAQAMEFPIIPCDLCGSARRSAAQCDEGDAGGDRRPSMPGRKDAMLRALAHVEPFASPRSQALRFCRAHGNQGRLRPGFPLSSRGCL
jgi:tRNA 2-thiocytidine biosynthesis protein TtcA